MFLFFKDFSYSDHMLKQSKAEVDTDGSSNQNSALTIEDKELKTEIIQKLTEKKVEIDNYNNGKNIVKVNPSKTCLIQ